MTLLNKLFGKRRPAQPPPPPEINLDREIESIKQAEAEDIPLGQRIHQFEYGDLILRLDRDIMKMYRVTANEGNEKRFSFSIRCAHKDYDALRKAYEEITAFLGGDRRLAGLPNHEGLKGHYFGI